MRDRVLSLLGLAAKSGNVASGEFQTLNAIRDGSAGLVIVAQDASDNTVKKFADKCRFYDVPFAGYSTKAALGHSIGRQERSCLAVTDAGLSCNLMKYLCTEEDGLKGGKENVKNQGR